MFYRKGVLKQFPIFTWKKSVLKFFLKKVAGLKAFNFIKRRFQRMCFPVNIAKFLRTPILKNICERLPL